MDGLQHSSALIGAARIVGQDRHRSCVSTRVARSRQVAGRNIGSSIGCGSGIGVVGVRQHPDLDPGTVDTERAAGNRGAQLGVGLGNHSRCTCRLHAVSRIDSGLGRDARCQNFIDRQNTVDAARLHQTILRHLGGDHRIAVGDIHDHSAQCRDLGADTSVDGVGFRNADVDQHAPVTHDEASGACCRKVESCRLLDRGKSLRVRLRKFRKANGKGFRSVRSVRRFHVCRHRSRSVGLAIH